MFVIACHSVIVMHQTKWEGIEEHWSSPLMFSLCNSKLFWPFIEEGYVKMFLRGRPVTMYMPKEQVETYNLEAKVELPAKRLKLEWVYPFGVGGLLGNQSFLMVCLKYVLEDI